MYTIRHKDYGEVSISQKPTRENLENKSVKQLLIICTIKRWNRKPFKKVLVDYILSLGELNF